MHKHIKRSARWEIRILYVFLIGLMTLGAYGIYNTNHQAYLNCVRVRDIQTYATQTVERSEKTLPTLAYYKNPDHADELRIQLKLLRQTKGDFTPVNCHRNIFGG